MAENRVQTTNHEVENTNWYYQPKNQGVDSEQSEHFTRKKKMKKNGKIEEKKRNLSKWDRI